jgi:hypothetical protein
MRNPFNKIVVRYSNNALRIRNCQTTVKPTKDELGPVTNYNEWGIYIRTLTDATYKAFNTIDTEIATEMLLAQAKYEILNPRLT